MRLYTFINYYLSSIQQGIQTAHIQGELANQVFKDNMTSFKSHMIKDWSINHKTIVVCNGGNGSSLWDLIKFFQHKENIYPWDSFCEDGDSLGGALTGVGIILPEEIYDIEIKFEYNRENGERVKTFIYSKVDEKNNNVRWILYNDPTDYRYQLIDRIKSAPLAK